MDFPMASHAVMNDALNAATKEENTFVSRPPKPCTKDTMKAAVTNATGAVKEQLILAWLTAGRVGDVLQLKQENVTLKPDAMAVQFRRGKGVELGSPTRSTPPARLSGARRSKRCCVAANPDNSCGTPTPRKLTR
jgi:hypothetical protein